MGIIKWFNDKWNKPEEPKEKPTPHDDGEHVTMSPLSDIDRVTNYFASGGEIVDLSNKERLPNDGFASDSDLIQPFNQAHVGTKEGIARLARRDRR